MWVLIDCNNFFVSCERVFRPDLWQRPVLVLSSNDGCVVSRSNETKVLGVKMGVPRFQIKDLIAKNKVTCFSSNFRLYADMSNRVMMTINSVVGRNRQEVYSIDECFVRGHDLGVKNWQEWAVGLKRKIEKETGIPVTIGVAKTKTLAKLAIEVAKKDVLGNGVMVWDEKYEPNWQERYLYQVDLNEVWGMGRQLPRKMFGEKIMKVGDFIKQDGTKVRKKIGLGGERTWRELRGESCIEMLEAEVSSRQILRSRSFGEGVTKRAEIGQAVAEYMTVAVENMRRHGWRARLVTVFIRTSRFVEREKNYYASLSLGLDEATSYLPDLVQTGEKILDKIWRAGFVYKKAGVILSGLEKEECWQPALLVNEGVGKEKGEGDEVESEIEERIEDEKKQKIMASMEKLNRRYGTRAVNVGRILSSDRTTNRRKRRTGERWRTKSEARSNEYTTNWQELFLVR